MIHTAYIFLGRFLLIETLKYYTLGLQVFETSVIFVYWREVINWNTDVISVDFVFITLRIRKLLSWLGFEYIPFAMLIILT